MINELLFSSLMLGHNAYQIHAARHRLSGMLGRDVKKLRLVYGDVSRHHSPAEYLPQEKTIVSNGFMTRKQTLRQIAGAIHHQTNEDLAKLRTEIDELQQRLPKENGVLCPSDDLETYIESVHKYTTVAATFAYAAVGWSTLRAGRDITFRIRSKEEEFDNALSRKMGFLTREELNIYAQQGSDIRKGIQSHARTYGACVGMTWGLDLETYCLASVVPKRDTNEYTFRAQKYPRYHIERDIKYFLHMDVAGFYNCCYKRGEQLYTRTRELQESKRCIAPQ